MLVFDTLTILFAFSSNLAFVAVVQASPLMKRDVIAPKIITPNADSVWTVGQVETVTWNTSDFPPDSQITNPIGKVVLGRAANHSLNLDLDHPLASGFKLRDGAVNLTVPDVPPRDDYLIVLFGDSGNTSPAFSITKIVRGPSDSSPSSSVLPSSSGDNPAPPQTATSSTSVVPESSSSLPPSTTDEAEPPTPSSTVPAGFTRSSTSSSSSYSSASPVATSVPANSSGTSLLTADNKLMVLTSCIVPAVLFLLV